MRHFLITRYMIGDPMNWTPDQKDYLNIKDDWIEHRHRLFEEFTYPSVMAQDDMDFTWLILCSDYMKKWCMSWLDIGNVHVVYGFNEYFKNHSRSLIPVVKEFLKPEDDLVLTTRLDSDDAIATYFIGRTKAAAEEGKVITWPHGYRLYKGKAYKANHIKNHFISYAERGEVETVYQQSHRQMITNFPYVEVPDYGWLEVIHDRNAKNTAESLGLLSSPPFSWEWSNIRGRFGL